MFVSGKNTFGAPERDVTKYSVPGRDGDLVTDNGRFKNIPVSYPAFIPFDFQEHAPRFREWISAQRGYQRLEDDYDPNTFRMARFVGPLSFSPRTLNKSAEFQVAFDCKPQRFLKSGEYPLTYTEPSGRIFPNPSPFPSKPLLTVYGEGEGTVILAARRSGSATSRRRSRSTVRPRTPIAGLQIATAISSSALSLSCRAAAWHTAFPAV